MKKYRLYKEIREKKIYIGYLGYSDLKELSIEELSCLDISDKKRRVIYIRDSEVIGYELIKKINTLETLVEGDSIVIDGNIQHIRNIAYNTTYDCYNIYTDMIKYTNHISEETKEIIRQINNKQIKELNISYLNEQEINKKSFFKNKLIKWFK